MNLTFDWLLEQQPPAEDFSHIRQQQCPRCDGAVVTRMWRGTLVYCSVDCRDLVPEPPKPMRVAGMSAEMIAAAFAGFAARRRRET